jgi:hypothetical protein
MLFTSAEHSRKAAAVLGMLIAGLIGAGAAAASPGGCQSWGVQPPNVGSGSNALTGVATTSACDAWAVGDYYNGVVDVTLIEHWNGTSWKHVPSPDPGGFPTTDDLNAVAASSSSNAWTVGSSFNGTVSKTLIAHWNGKTWKQVKSLNAGGSTPNDILRGVAATSSSNAWAVGDNYNGTADQTLIEHWNGKAWKLEPSPNPGGSSHDNVLNGVTATSSSNAVAVGYYTNPGTGIDQTLVERWDGKAWKVQRSPNGGGLYYTNKLRGVAAVSSSDAWAVGQYHSAADQTLVEHWNGKTWKLEPSPNPGGTSNLNSLAGVAATSPRNAWAVGDYFNGSGYQTLIERWDGKAWKVQPSANPGDGDNILNAVAATSPSNVWAVGSTGQTLALHCC